MASNIVNSWKQDRMHFQLRYADYAKRYQKTHSLELKGHMHECSYTLITVFGLTPHQVLELEKHDFAGLTDKEWEREEN